MISNHFRGLIAEDTPAGNDGDTPGFAQPVSQTEIEELLYGDDWPAGSGWPGCCRSAMNSATSRPRISATTIRAP